jgi:hypothetical protein
VSPWRHARAALAACALVACASERELAEGLVAASTPARLPKVVACWEREHEAMGLRGSYRVTVDLVVEGGSSRLRRARVTAIEPGPEVPPGRATDGLARCIEAALDATTLPRARDAEGPGLSSLGDVEVRGLRLALEPSRVALDTADRAAHVLVGPRAERCQGLFLHEPPRDAATLLEEIASHEAQAARQGLERDALARALQRVFDLRLELLARIARDRELPSVSAASKKKLDELELDTKKAARRVGARIGCAFD